MLGFLNGVPGKLATLVNRLTSTWAAKLDTLHDSRLTSTWAAKLDTLAANFTSTISARIDAPISATAKASNPILLAALSSGVVAGGQKLAAAGYSMELLGPIVSSDNTTTTYADVVNITGSGVLNFVANYTSGGSSGSNVSVLIDGVEVISLNNPVSSNVGLVVAVGGLVGTTGAGVVSMTYEAIPFATSLQIRHKALGAGTSANKTYYKYRRAS